MIAHKPTTEEGVRFIQEAFATEQECLEASLRSSNRIQHQGDKGEVNEEHFIDALRHYLPDRYTVEKASVIDSQGNTSDSIDVVVFDRQYTPTLLDNNKHRYVPAESVYAIFECKPTINSSYLQYAADKAASVRSLHRTSIAIHHAGGKFPAKKLQPIISGILSIDVEWVGGLGETFEHNHQLLTGNRQLDCGFAATGACFDVFDENDTYTYGPSENAWAFFAFRLLERLQRAGTVPAVDWSAYASQLSKNLN